MVLIPYQEIRLKINKTIQSYQNKNNDYTLLHSHIKWIEKLPYYIEIKLNQKLYFLTHGYGLPYDKRKNESSNKQSFLSNCINNSKYLFDWEDILTIDKNIINIFGHCVFENVLIDKDNITPPSILWDRYRLCLW